MCVWCVCVKGWGQSRLWPPLSPTLPRDGPVHPPGGGELVGAQEPSRCDSNLATRRSPLQGNPGEHTAHWAGLKIHPHGFNVTPEVKIHPTRSCWLGLPHPTLLSPSGAFEGRRGGLAEHFLHTYSSAPETLPALTPHTQQSPEETGALCSNCG